MADKGLPRAPRIRYQFQHPTFDFFCQWVAGAQTHGGSETGEILYAASQIRSGDPESWHDAWTEMAGRVLTQAQESEKRGHRVSARESYLRAYTYRRAALAFLSPRRDARYSDIYREAQGYFRRAAALFDPPMEAIAIPFAGKVLPGYFLRVDDSGRPRKTLLMIGGGDTFVEDTYMIIGPAAVKRGYNVLMVDLPGQGILPAEGLTFQPDTEVPMRAVVDYLVGRPEVDPERLAAYGISAGGYLVPRAAAYEKRIRACVACCLLVDFGVVWGNIDKAEKSLRFRLYKALFPRRLEAILRLSEYYQWRWGVNSSAGLVEVCRAFTLDPSRITCPTLNLVSEQEYAYGPIRASAERCRKEIQHPNKPLVIAPRNQGADSHGIGTNLSLAGQIILDWLDELFD